MRKSRSNKRELPFLCVFWIWWYCFLWLLSLLCGNSVLVLKGVSAWICVIFWWWIGFVMGSELLTGFVIGLIQFYSCWFDVVLWLWNLILGLLFGYGLLGYWFWFWVVVRVWKLVSDCLWLCWNFFQGLISFDPLSLAFFSSPFSHDFQLF